MCCGLLQSPSMSQRSFGHRDRRLPSEQALLWSCLVQRKRHMLPKDMNRFKTIAFAQLFQFLFPFTPSIAYVKSPKPAFTSVHETCEERRPVDKKRFSLSHAPRLVALDLRFYCRFQLNLTHPAVRVQPKRWACHGHMHTQIQHTLGWKKYRVNRKVKMSSPTWRLSKWRSCAWTEVVSKAVVAVGHLVAERASHPRVSGGMPQGKVCKLRYWNGSSDHFSTTINTY